MSQIPPTVLVIDDDLAIQKLAADALRAEGYKVLVASDFPEALHVADGHEAVIDVALIDIMLPSGNGIGLARALLAKRPNIQVLYTSGFNADSIQAVQHEAVPNGGFLEKPFLPRILVERVRTMVPLKQTPASSIDPVADDNPDAVYRLESKAKCPQCGEAISTLRAVRLLRIQVNFISTLPRRGRIITCPSCFTIVPAELTNF